MERPVKAPNHWLKFTPYLPMQSCLNSAVVLDAKKQKKDKNCVLGQQCTGQNPEKRENTHLLENHD